MTLSRTLAPVIFLAILTTGASAQTGAPVDRDSLSPEARMNMAVAAHVFEYIEGYEGLFEPGDVFRLGMVAKMKAVALTCDGFDLDTDKYNALMADILGPLTELPENTEVEEPTINLPFTIAMSAYTMFIGGNLAVSAYDPAGFCAFGDELRTQLAEDDASHLLIWKDKN